MTDTSSFLQFEVKSQRVKVELHDAVIYGFPYKLRPKPKIARACGELVSDLVSSPRAPPRERVGSGDETVLVESLVFFSHEKR